LIRITGERSEPFTLWLDNVEALKFAAEILRRLNIAFTIPRNGPLNCNKLIVCSNSTSIAYDCGNSKDILHVNCDLLLESRLAFALELLRKVVGKIHEAVLGVDLGQSRSAMALISAGSLVYSRVTNSMDDIVKEICLASPLSPELIVSVGFSPAVALEAKRFVKALKDCGCKAFIVDEFKSNEFKAYGINGVNKYTEKDVIAAIQIALRVYDNIVLHGI
jgi:hypothetical protein